MKAETLYLSDIIIPDSFKKTIPMSRFFEESVICYGKPSDYCEEISRESFSGSPCCSGVYVEIFECEECGDYITGDYIKTARDDRICKNCYMIFEIGGEL